MSLMKIGVLPRPYEATSLRAIVVALSTSLPSTPPEPSEQSPNTTCSAAMPAYATAILSSSEFSVGTQSSNSS